jgi:hypothetical protein
MIRRSSLPFVVALLVIPGCVGDADDRSRASSGTTLHRTASAIECSRATPGVTVRDSGAVRIHEHTGSSIPIDLDARAAVQIGADEGSSEYVFGRIVGATRLSDGSVVIGDGIAGEFRIFDAKGKFVRRFGGLGHGPGEYQNLHGMFQAGFDTLWILDAWGSRLTVLDDDSKVVATRSIPGIPVEGTSKGHKVSGVGRTIVVGRLGGDTLLAIARPLTFNDPAGLKPGEARTERRVSRLKTLAPDGQPITDLGEIVEFEHYMYITPRKLLATGFAPFGANTSVAAASRGFWQTDGERYEIRKRSASGDVLTIVRECKSPPAVRKDDIASYIELEASRAPANQRKDKRAELEHIGYPNVKPAFSHLLVDRRGRLWAREYSLDDESATWQVYDSSGKWVTAVRTPANSIILEAGLDYVLTRVSDELGVQSVNLYPFSDLQSGGR